MTHFRSAATFLFFSLNFTCPSQYSCNDHKTKMEIICIYIEEKKPWLLQENSIFIQVYQNLKKLSAQWDNSKSKILSTSIEMQPQQSVQ